MFRSLMQRAAKWAQPVGRCRPPRRSPPLRLEELEARDQPSTTGGLMADSVPAGAAPIVTVKDASNGAIVFTLQPYATAFTGGVNVAVGNGLIVTAPGRGGGPDVKVFDSSGNLVRSIMPYNPAFTGGVNVAIGDLGGDGVPDIITAPGAGGGADIKIINGNTGALERSFFAYDPAFTGGASVAAGDVNADGSDDVITGAGQGGGPTVRVFDGRSGGMLANFAAFDPFFTGGVSVAAQDITLDGRADIIVGTGPLVPTQVGVFDGKDVSHVLSRFFPFGATDTNGAAVAAGTTTSAGQGTIRVGHTVVPVTVTNDHAALAQALVDAVFTYNPQFGNFSESGA